MGNMMAYLLQHPLFLAHILLLIILVVALVRFVRRR